MANYSATPVDYYENVDPADMYKIIGDDWDTTYSGRPVIPGELDSFVDPTIQHGLFSKSGDSNNKDGLISLEQLLKPEASHDFSKPDVKALTGKSIPFVDLDEIKKTKERINLIHRMVLKSNSGNHSNHIQSMKILKHNLEEFGSKEPFVLHDDKEKKRRWMYKVEFEHKGNSNVLPGRNELNAVEDIYTARVVTREEDYDMNTPTNYASRGIGGVEVIKHTEQINIPKMIEFSGVSSEGGVPELNQPGGFFIPNNNKKKIIIHKRHNVSTRPKPQSRKKTNGQFQCCFYSVSPKFTDLQHPHTLPRYSNCVMSGTDDGNYEFSMIKTTKQSAETVDLLKIIARTTGFPREKLFMYLASGFTGKVRDFIEHFLQRYNPDDIENNMDFQKEEQDPRDWFPHLTVAGKFTKHSFLQERVTTGYMCMEIIRVLLMTSFYRTHYPSRSCVSMKRIQSPGQLIFQKITEAYNKHILDYKLQITNNEDRMDSRKKTTASVTTKILNIYSPRDSTITRTLTIRNNNHIIVAPHQFSNDPRKLLTNVIPTRKIDETTIDTEDVTDTPSSSSTIGLMKRLTSGVKITDCTHDSIRKQFETVIQFSIFWAQKHYEPEVEPVPIHVIEESIFPITYINQTQVQQFVADFRAAKRRGRFNSLMVGISTPVSYDNENELHITKTYKYMSVDIHISISRFAKAMFCIHNGEIEIGDKIDTTMDLHTYMKNYPDSIEYVDGAQKIYSNNIVSYDRFLKTPKEDRVKYDFMEISEDLCMSINTALLGDVGKLDGIRITMGNAQMKQIVLPPVNHIKDSGESGPVLSNMVQRSCLTNNTIIESGLFNNGKGENVLIMYADYAWNHNDSIIFNKDAVESGLLAATHYIPTTIENTMEGSNETPEKWKSNQSKINPKTLCPDMNTLLFEDDAIARSVALRSIGEDLVPYDASKTWVHRDAGRVIKRHEHPVNRKPSVTINAITYCPVRVGDKFCTENVQKGTVGVLLRSEELPYTADGEVPTIIINATSIVGRNTYSAYTQMILTQLWLLEPNDEEGFMKFRDLNVVNTDCIADLYENVVAFAKYKYPDWTDEFIRNRVGAMKTMYHPVTGEPLEKKVWLAPAMECRLTQMASEKINIRGSSGKHTKFGQPPSGKKNAGGGRQGEMELECISTHGTAGVMKEICTDSTKSYTRNYYCSHCRVQMTIQYGMNREHFYVCKSCEAQGIISTPYASDHSLATMIMQEVSKLRGLQINVVPGDEEINYEAVLKKHATDRTRYVDRKYSKK